MERCKGMATLAIILVISLTAAVVGVISSKYLGDDNAIEQTAEKIIEEESGIVVDLSPEES